MSLEDYLALTRFIFKSYHYRQYNPDDSLIKELAKANQIVINDRKILSAKLISLYSTKVYPEAVVLNDEPYILWDNAYWDIYTNIVSNLVMFSEYEEQCDVDSINNIIESEIYRFLSLIFYSDIKLSLHFGLKSGILATRPTKHRITPEAINSIKNKYNKLILFTKIYCFYHEFSHLVIKTNSEAYKKTQEDFNLAQSLLENIPVFDIGVEIDNLDDYIKKAREEFKGDKDNHFKEELLCDYRAFFATESTLFDLFSDFASYDEIYTFLEEAIMLSDHINQYLSIAYEKTSFFVNHISQEQIKLKSDDLSQKYVYRFYYSKYTRHIARASLSMKRNLSYTSLLNEDKYILKKYCSKANILEETLMRIVAAFEDNAFVDKHVKDLDQARNFLLLLNIEDD